MVAVNIGLSGQHPHQPGEEPDAAEDDRAPGDDVRDLTVEMYNKAPAELEPNNVEVASTHSDV